MNFYVIMQYSDLEPLIGEESGRLDPLKLNNGYIFEVENYTQILTWFLEFLLLTYNTIFKFGDLFGVRRGVDSLKLKHCHILK